MAKKIKQLIQNDMSRDPYSIFSITISTSMILPSNNNVKENMTIFPVFVDRKACLALFLARIFLCTFSVYRWDFCLPQQKVDFLVVDKTGIPKKAQNNIGIKPIPMLS